MMLNERPFNIFPGNDCGLLHMSGSILLFLDVFLNGGEQGCSGAGRRAHAHLLP